MLINSNVPLVVFEHESVRFDKGEKRITEDQFKALQRYYGEGVPYFDLICNGVKFKEYVGVIQIGNSIIEVLPKADKGLNGDNEETLWRDILIGMLKAVGSFDIKVTSESNLKIRRNNILDIYFEMFIKEVEYLLHSGLVKRYRKKEGNVTTLKGNLQFGKHIQQNITHQERFFVKYTTYDAEHLLHFILYAAIAFLKHVNTNAGLHSRIGALLLYFPEMPCIKVTDATFIKITYNRKTQGYKKAIEIARLLLLNYHPDLSKGRDNVLALMFDMNRLWEKFVCSSLRKYSGEDIEISAQNSKLFWRPDDGYDSKIRPDIWIKKKDVSIILDTKWKNINCYNPSPEDLRQMYVYHAYYNAVKVALVYPGIEQKSRSGFFIKKDSTSNDDKECSVVLLNVNKSINVWQKEIADKLLNM